jgi:hypothetical protein
MEAVEHFFQKKESGTHKSYWVCHRYVIVKRSDGKERQYGCRVYEAGEYEDGEPRFTERPPLSRKSFDRFVRMFKRLRRRKGFIGHSIYRMQGWYGEMKPYREIILRRKVEEDR